jgi:SAM-dependent methyltransferase
MAPKQLFENHKNTIKRFLDMIGYDHSHWARFVMYEQCGAMIDELNPAEIDALEISPGPRWRKIGFKSFTEVHYPKFDICKDVLDRTFDLIIADNIFEHLLWPYRAARNVHTMMRPGGHFLVTVPFLIKLHSYPYDCTRWTETGIKYFLNECGFPLDSIRTGSWGSRACVKANFLRWARMGWFRSLKNEPAFPVAVWALAEKEPSTQDLP